MVKWVLGLVIAGLFIGCSIEKRHYTGGYYIKWHKRHVGSRNHAKAEKETDTTLVLVRQDSVAEVLVEDTVLIVADQEELVSPTLDSVAIPQKEKRIKPADLPKEQRKFEPLGVLSVKVLLVDFIVALLSDTTSDHKQYVVYSALILVGLLLAFVLGICSMVRYLRNPRHYKFNIWGILGVLIPLLFFILMIIGTAALF